MMTTTFLCLALLSAWPEDDAPIQYEAQKQPAKARKLKQHGPTVDIDEDGHLTDDPNAGISIEGLSGVMLLDSSRGGGVDPKFMLGARATWEMGRLLRDEFWRETLFVDVLWSYAWSSEGTTDVKTSVNYHYFTVAPAFALPWGKLPIAVFAQVGVGLSMVPTSIETPGNVSSVTGMKLLIQYGAGIRFRPALVESKRVRLSFRIEATRFRRGYMDDTLLGGSIGLTF